MAQYTQEELAALGRKVLIQKEKDKARGRAYTEAVKELIGLHREDFEKLFGAAKKNQGL